MYTNAQVAHVVSHLTGVDIKPEDKLSLYRLVGKLTLWDLHRLPENEAKAIEDWYKLYRRT